MGHSAGCGTLSLACQYGGGLYAGVFWPGRGLPFNLHSHIDLINVANTRDVASDCIPTYTLIFLLLYNMTKTSISFGCRFIYIAAISRSRSDMTYILIYNVSAENLFELFMRSVKATLH